MTHQFMFLDNTPCGEDLFEGKSQDIIASNISDLLLNNPKCKIIGIDGGWGSGKSNVVHQIKNKIDKEYHFFIYDAWGHQEDLQRRAILEELTQDLIDVKLLPNTWQIKLKQLLAKSREIQTKTMPKLSYGIIISAFAIILSPLFKTISDVFGSRHICWRILITSIPFIIIFITYICYIFKEKSIGKALSRMYFIYKDKQKDDTTYETISEDEPSVAKFRQWMKDLSKDLKTKRLVIVFDNMDRLPQKKVQELWSSIHAFFAETPYDNIRVIIPFDREHIKSAFKGEDLYKGSKPEDNKCFGNDFIDKTFNVVYRVSPPIMSDWKTFFETQWEKAFGKKDSSSDYGKVVQIYDLVANDITPRKIIAFINEFVAIKQQTIKAPIPERYIALFILGKQKISENPMTEIISPTYLGAIDFLYQTDEDMPKYIASLFYQVDSERAIQVVFTDKLKKALDKNKEDDLLTISKIPNFYDLLENAIAGISNIENAALALNHLPNEQIGSESQVKHIWECIYKQVKHTSYETISDGQLVLLSKINNKISYAKRILDDISGSGIFRSMPYCESIDKIQDLGINIFKHLKKQSTTFQDLSLLVVEKKEDWSKYEVRCQQNDLDSYIDQVDPNIESLQFAQYLKSYYNLDILIGKIEDQIESIRYDTPINRVELLFDIYKKTSELPLRATLSEQILASTYESLSPTSPLRQDIVAMAISELPDLSRPALQQVDSLLQNTDSEFTKEVANIIHFYIRFDELLTNTQSMEKYTMYKEVVKLVLKNPLPTFAKFDISVILPYFDSICNILRIGDIEVLKGIDKLSNNIEVIDETNIKTSTRFIVACLSCDTNLSIHIKKVLSKYLDKLDTKQCITALDGTSSFEFQCLFAFEEYTISQSFFEAIQQKLESVAKKDIGILDGYIWNNLIERLDKQGRSLLATFNTIRDIFCQQMNISNELFALFIDWLFKYSELDGKTETLRAIFKSDIIRENYVLSRIINNQEVMIRIVKNAGNEAADFKAVISDIAKTNQSEELISFANAIGIKIVKKEYK